jgi:hypothetical protein
VSTDAGARDGWTTSSALVHGSGGVPQVGGNGLGDLRGDGGLGSTRDPLGRFLPATHGMSRADTPQR